MKEYLQIRKEFKASNLSKKDVDKDPVRQFEAWYIEAEQAGIREANAMSLSTVDARQKPHSRIVLLRDFDAKGFVFFTNYESNKGDEIRQNPYASLLFFWSELERQVRIEGKIERLSTSRSDKYFISRPTGSKIGAWASPQSREIENREILEKIVQEKELMFEKTTLKRPEFWGGYILTPESFEFWQGRESRLHDRIKYIRNKSDWEILRLAP